MNTSKSLDSILPCNCGMNDILNGKHYDDCPKALKQAIVEAVEGLIYEPTKNMPTTYARIMQAIKEWQDVEE